MTYTPTNNTTATYGEQSPAVTKLQMDLNSKNANTPGYTPLVIDGKYGPLTQSATQFGVKPTSPMLSTAGVSSEYDSNSAKLNDLTTQPDPYLAIYDSMVGNNKVAENTAITNATANAERSNLALQQNQNEYMAGLNTAGVQSGANRYLPEYQAGILESARQNYIGKFQAIANAEKIAIAEAQTARQSGDVKLMKEKLDYINDLRKQKATAISEANKLEWEKEKFNQEMKLNWFKANSEDKKRNKGEDDTETTDATVKFNPSKIQLRRLSLNGVPTSVITAMTDLLNQGKTYEEALAELPPEIRNSISKKGLKVLENSVTPISKGQKVSNVPTSTATPETQTVTDTTIETPTTNETMVTDTIAPTPTPRNKKVTPTTIANPFGTYEPKTAQEHLAGLEELINTPLVITPKTTVAEAEKMAAERKAKNDAAAKKTKESLQKTWKEMSAAQKKADEERKAKIEALKKKEASKKSSQIIQPLKF